MGALTNNFPTQGTSNDDESKSGFPVDVDNGVEPDGVREERVALDVDHERHHLQAVHNAH